MASVCSYGGLQGTGNRDYCAVATQVSPSGIRAGLPGGLLVGVGSVFTLVTGRLKVAWHRQMVSTDKTLPIISIRFCLNVGISQAS